MRAAPHLEFVTGSILEWPDRICDVAAQHRGGVPALEEALDFANQSPTPTPPAATVEEPLGPKLYDTGLDTSEGLWLRQGWADHS